MNMMAEVSVQEIVYMPNVDRVIRDKECRFITSLGKTTIWTLEKDGKFPKRRKVGPKASGWLLSEVQAWIRGDWHPGWKAEQQKQ